MKASLLSAVLVLGVAPLVAGAQPSNTRPDTLANRAPAAQEREVGLRPLLASRGLTVSLGVINDVSSIAAGGVRNGSATRALFNGIVEADLEPLMGWRGASLLVGYAAQRGDNGSEYAGDVQAFSNIDATRFAHLYEAWFQQSFGDVARVKVGRVDANTEYAAVDGASNFINASAGFSPTITGLPTYPDPVPSLNLFVRPLSWLEIGAGYFKGTFDDIESIDGVVKDKFMIAQATVSWQGGYVHAGRWQHSGLAVRFDGGLESRPGDWYAAVEQRVSGAAEEEGVPASGVRVFGKYGRAPGSVATFQQHLMAGVVLDGGLRRRSEDAAGLAVTHADLSNDPASGFTKNETTLEAFYRLPVLGSLALRPDLQYIMHPSGSTGVRNALVATLRFDVSY